MKTHSWGRSQKNNFIPKAITGIAPVKMRKMLKDTIVMIFDKYVHMVITKSEAHVLRFFDTLLDQEAFDTFTDNMTKYLKACRINTIHLTSDDGKSIKISNIDDYIAELLNTNDINELSSILSIIDERQLGDIKMETKQLINNARQKIPAYIH